MWWASQFRFILPAQILQHLDGVCVEVMDWDVEQHEAVVFEGVVFNGIQSYGNLVLSTALIILWVSLYDTAPQWYSLPSGVDQS